VFNKNAIKCNAREFIFLLQLLTSSYFHRLRKFLGRFISHTINAGLEGKGGRCALFMHPLFLQTNHVVQQRSSLVC
jgi:hypothetical protein